MSNYPPRPPPSYSETNKFQQAPPIPMSQPAFIGSGVIIVGEHPMPCTCPQCGNRIVTRTEKKAGLLAWLVCAGLFVVGCWPCYFIPFCVDACKDTEHYCPSCNAFIGKSKPL